MQFFTCPPGETRVYLAGSSTVPPVVTVWKPTPDGYQQAHPAEAAVTFIPASTLKVENKTAQVVLLVAQV